MMSMGLFKTSFLHLSRNSRVIWKKVVGECGICKNVKTSTLKYCLVIMATKAEPGFAGDASGKKLPANVGDVRGLPANVGDVRGSASVSGLGRSPGGWDGNPLWYSCLENPMDRGARWGFSTWGRKESDTTEATKHTHTHTHTGWAEAPRWNLRLRLPHRSLQTYSSGAEGLCRFLSELVDKLRMSAILCEWIKNKPCP